MDRNRSRSGLFGGRRGGCAPTVLLLGVLGCFPGAAAETGPAAAEPPRVTSISVGQVEASLGGKVAGLRAGRTIGPWTLMAVVLRPEGRGIAVFEDFTRKDGRMVFADPGGILADLPKSCEPTFAAPAGLYRGHTFEDVFRSEKDLLAGEILAGGRDPSYAEVAACFPPISKMYTYTFVGTNACVEKVGFEPGGRSPNFDPAAYAPEVAKARAAGRVFDGLVGGWLPAVRFVYPGDGDSWSEMIAFAPFRMECSNDRVQPVWYRVARIEGGSLRWVRAFDSYHPFPPRLESPNESFYAELLQMREAWLRLLEPAMLVEIPDRRLADMALHSLVRERMTRVGPFPKYGVFDRGYGGSEHDGFPDTFNVATAAMVEWGLLDVARAYIENYFKSFVRDDGSILYRGPETGQLGRMLTVAAAYCRAAGDGDFLLEIRSRLDGVARVLLSLREKALDLPKEDPAHGMIAGWSEADACLDPEPARYMQPYFSNSTEAARGFREIGSVWMEIGSRKGDRDLAMWGRKLADAAADMEKDIQTSIARSIIRDGEAPCLPAIAGAREPFHVAVAKDRLDPQFRSYRAYMEMLHSGGLQREPVGWIVRYRASHGDTILGIPTAYGHGTGELAGFLTYGHAFGLIQHDFIREYLLVLDAVRAHQYTRGTWTAPETRNIDPRKHAAPYCVPAQLVVPLMLRWMLVFEDPASGAIWLAKATPRDWLAHGERISVSGAPTRWGPMGFAIVSRLAEDKIEASVELPRSPVPSVKLRLRAPQGKRMLSVEIDGRPWKAFDLEEESITLPAAAEDRISITARMGS